MSHDEISGLIAAASDSLRETMHVPSTPEFPSDMATRAGNLVDLLGKLSQVVRHLDDTLKRAPQLWELDANDDAPPAHHIAAGSLGLRAAAAAVDDAHRHANTAFASLSHLKVR
jgi:hypothetical protein